jgi:hypothetical protein
VIGEAGSGKTALLQAFARYAEESHPDLVAVRGTCSAYTGIGDPYRSGRSWSCFPAMLKGRRVRSHGGSEATVAVDAIRVRRSWLRADPI